MKRSFMLVLCLAFCAPLFSPKEGSATNYSNDYYRTHSYSSTPFEAGKQLITVLDTSAGATQRGNLSIQAGSKYISLIASQTVQPSIPSQSETVDDVNTGRITTILTETVNVSTSGCSVGQAKTIGHNVSSSYWGAVGLCGSMFPNTICGFTAPVKDTNPGVCHSWSFGACPCGSALPAGYGAKVGPSNELYLIGRTE